MTSQKNNELIPVDEKTSPKTNQSISFYIKTHWKGQHSLKRSYWINTFAINILLSFFLIVIQTMFSVPKAFISTCLLFSSIIAVWQFVGLWRASKGQGGWGHVIKVLVVIGWVMWLSSIYQILSNFS